METRNIAPEEKDISPNNGQEILPVAETLTKVPALIVLGVLAYFALKK